MPLSPVRRIVLLSGFAAAVLFAQEWQSASTLPGVDTSALNARQKETALRLLRVQDCTCGCGMKVAECRVKDPACGFSKSLSAVVVDSVRQGKNDKDVLADVVNSPYGHPRQPDTRLLGDPVKIPLDGAPAIGPDNARVTIVEFSDFQCPFCIAATPELHAVLQAYPHDVKLIFKEFPLERHSMAATAAAFALAAQKQGKFWPMHDAIFAARGNISKPSLMMLAGTLRIDTKRLQTDLTAPDIQKTIEKDLADGERAGVQGTPTIFIDGQRFNGPINLAALRPVLDEKIKKAH